MPGQGSTLVRPLNEADVSAGSGLLEALGQKSARDALESYKEIRQNPGHLIFVAESGSRIAGVITVVIEPKFIHGGSRAGHIEGLAVRQESRGSGVGRALVEAALAASKKAGCYKTVLDCPQECVAFYQKMGFSQFANCMKYAH